MPALAPYCPLSSAASAPLAISKRIGHFDVAFTLSRYGHVLRDEDEQMAARMERLAPKAERLASRAVSISNG